MIKRKRGVYRLTGMGVLSLNGVLVRYIRTSQRTGSVFVELLQDASCYKRGDKITIDAWQLAPAVDTRV